MHVTFHGCLQDYATVGFDYINNAGFNEWADTNNIIILYPQTVATIFAPENPNGCWDWWGYNNNPSTYDTKSGVQMQVIYSMIQQVSSGYVDLNAPINLRVLNETNNSVGISWSSVSGANGYVVYRNQQLVTSTPVVSLSYVDSGLSSGTTYEYSVAGVSGEGSPGAISAPIYATTTGTPPPLVAPTSLQASFVFFFCI